MAARNPAWSRDELILALDLYLRLGPYRACPAIGAGGRGVPGCWNSGRAPGSLRSAA